MSAIAAEYHFFDNFDTDLFHWNNKRGVTFSKIQCHLHILQNHLLFSLKNEI